MSDIIEVVTPQAAARLFCRSPEAVRAAVRGSHVQTLAEIAFTAKPVRLITLRSARDYWEGRVPRLAPASLESELHRMREWAVVMELPWGERLRILHPNWIVAPSAGSLGTESE